MLGTIAVLDACVLYPAFLRDILLRLAEAELFSPRWSAAIQAEWMRNLLENRPDLTRPQLERTRARMEAAFPQALITGYNALIDTIVLPDAGDRHVVAAAIRSQAGVIITSNLSDFPATVLSLSGLQAVHPDAFVAALYDELPGDTIAILRDHRDQLTRPPKSAVEYIDKLRQHQLKKTADLVHKHAGDI